MWPTHLSANAAVAAVPGDDVEKVLLSLSQCKPGQCKLMI